MKSFFIVGAICLLSLFAQAQNVFPTPTGSVGIGTTSPSALLHVHNPTSLGTSAGSTTEIARFSGVNANISQLRFQLNRYASGNDWYSASMRLQHVTDYTNAGYIEFDPINGNTGVAIGSANTEIVRFLSSGNVGIGTTNPGNKLQIADGADDATPYGTVQVIRAPNPSDNKFHLSFIRSGQMYSGIGYVNGTNTLGVWGGGNTSTTPTMSFTQGGSVGIGTADPQSYKLAIDPKGAGGMVVGNPTVTGGNYTQVVVGISAQTNGYPYVQGVTASGSSYGVLAINPNGGNVLIGKTSQANSNYLLDINGSARANKVVVNTTGADFVFDSSYALKSLDTVENYIQQNKHLPDIEPASQMQKDGVDLGTNQTKLLQKIEELTLYIIQQNKRLEQQETHLQALENELRKVQNNKIAR